MWIMVAGPYRSGQADASEQARRLTAMNEAAVALLRQGHTPVIGVNMALPVIAVAGEDAYDEVMMPLSLALTERCDAILRLGGESAGADAEVRLFLNRGKPVFFTLEEVPI